MEKLNCIIVEDEPLAAEVLDDYVKQVPYLNLVAICSDAMYALEVLRKGNIKVVFLDIHLPGLKGNEFLKTLKDPPQVIITTAYRDYAIEGYELNVTDYLVKPINFNRFLMAVNKLKPRSAEETAVPALSAQERDHFFFNVNKKKVKMYLDDILYVESLKEYVRITARDKSILTKYQLGEIEELLSKSNFIRVHRSFLVAKEKIDAFSATDVEIGGKHIPIGRNYKEQVHSLLGDGD
jgi:DNA-binding LytR/AlgR family response regulator